MVCRWMKSEMCLHFSNGFGAVAYWTPRVATAAVRLTIPPAAALPTERHLLATMKKHRSSQGPA